MASLLRIFSVPESEHSTLGRIERDISRNINGFLSKHVVSGDRMPDELETDFLDTKIPEDPWFVSDQAHFLLEKVVAQSVHTANPKFIGHMTSAIPYFMLPLTKIMVALNQNLVKIETSKAFTPLEKQVIGMLHRLVYELGDDFYATHTHARDLSLGTVTTDGTIANIMAMWVARNRLLCPKGEFRGVQQDGLARGLAAHGIKDLAILVSERGHYSLKKTADLLGLGHRSIHTIATVGGGRVSPERMRDEARRLTAAGTKILAIVGVAGTTESGHVDPLNELADMSQEFQCHYHVDAAWGGPTLFSPKHKHLLSGIERADSVTFDAHKQLYTPMGAGMILFRDPTAAQAIEHHASYILREGSRDLGRHSLEGSRPGMALLVHSALRIIGKKGYALLIDGGIKRAQTFADMITKSNDFELTTPPQLNILTYRYMPSELRPMANDPAHPGYKAANDFLNDLCIRMQKDQRDHGISFVSRTTLHTQIHGNEPITVLRVILANPLTTTEILQEILHEQRDLALKILKQPAVATSLKQLLN